MITSIDELGSATRALSLDVSRASTHCRAFSQIADASRRYGDVFDLSLGFWKLTFQAHLAACLQALARVYDNHRRALSMAAWLRAISSFASDGRLSPLSQVTGENLINPTRLAQDIEYCTENHIAERLRSLRHKALAHTAAEYAAKGENAFQTFRLEQYDIEELVGGSREIFCHYLPLFSDRRLIVQVPGQDDFVHLLDLAGLAARLRP